jgi:hypothetical protein
MKHHYSIPILVETLLNGLMKPDWKLVNDKINSLVDENNVLLGGSIAHKGFCYRGYYFKYGAEVVPDMGFDPVLHKSLHHKAEGLADRWNYLKGDYDYLKRLFTELLRPCVTEQDVRDTLPECVIQFHPTLGSLPRIRGEAWTIRCDKALQFRYNSAIDRIRTYSVMHLLTS